MLGIGGAGLSGAARLLLAQGHRVSGHDRCKSPFASALRDLDVVVEFGESAAAAIPHGAELVVRSAAIPDSDPQVLEARERGLPVWKYAQLLGRLGPARRTMAVAGTHGKTTSAWMLYHALAGVARLTGGPSPGALVGGTDVAMGTNALAPGAGTDSDFIPRPGRDSGIGSSSAGVREATSGWFAVEACEYDRTFLQLGPEAAIVTNVEADHLDYYGSLEAVESAFARFLDRVHPDGLVVCGRDVPERVTHAAAPRVWRMGHELHIDSLSEEHGCHEFRLRGPGWATPALRLCVPGEFNVENAALAIALAVGLAGGDHDPGALAKAAAESLSNFRGVERRFESWFRHGDVEVIHDYAHHPTEVRVNIEAARRRAPDRPVHVLFQPHQHSRTARFLSDFVDALRHAHAVVVTDVYGARVQIDSQAAGAEELVRQLHLARVKASFGGPAIEAGEVLVRGLPDACTVLVLGAGDIDGIRDDLEERLAVRGAATCTAS